MDMLDSTICQIKSIDDMFKMDFNLHSWSWVRLSCSWQGESGLGKTTFVNTLFNTQVMPTKQMDPPTEDLVKKSIQIQDHVASTALNCVNALLDLEENGVRLKLTVVDTPGFGDALNNEDSWRPILENVESRFDAFLEQDFRVNRENMTDTRIHACLYFISPSGHS